MKHEKNHIIFGIFSILFLSMFFYAIYINSKWYYDAIFAEIILIVLLFFCFSLDVDWKYMLLFSFAILAHALGIFGFYAINYGEIGYDTFVHLFSSISGAMMMFHIFSRKIEIRVKRDFGNRHIFLLMFIVISLVTLCGVFVEIIEFSGYFLLGGVGEGILFPTDSISSTINNFYLDTIFDLLTNLIGSIIGVGIFGLFILTKKKN